MNILKANWPAPSSIHAFTTQRGNANPAGGYASFNLADHVGDDTAQVARNRQHLQDAEGLPSAPIWLNQTHSIDCVVVEGPEVGRNADAAVTRQPNTVLAIMTADCLPITLCNQQGNEIAAIHAGWRGLVNGILETTQTHIQSEPNQCMAWIGPAICGQCYATGEEVLDQFTQRYPFATQAFYRNNHQWYADLPKIATKILEALGISPIYQSHACTFESNNHYYSYRREPQTGRIATLMWFQDTV